MPSGLGTFTITYGPDWSRPRTTSTLVLKNDFGDGYGQRAADGINSVRQSWDLAWSNLSPTEAQAADAFLASHGGYTAFYWTAPFETVAKKWICDKWVYTPDDPNGHKIACAFVQVFDL